MRTLYIVRGVSGAGKSTFAEKLPARVLSADTFFERGGEYKFDATKLKEAHAWCREYANSIMRTNEDLAIANTFTTEWEMEAYYMLAEKYNYKVFSIIVENRHQGVSVHDVPEETLKKQKARFDIKL